jgi:hypothetical protein
MTAADVVVYHRRAEVEWHLTDTRVVRSAQRCSSAGHLHEEHDVSAKLQKGAATSRGRDLLEQVELERSPSTPTTRPSYTKETPR